MKSNTLSLDIETLVELTPEDARQVNGGLLTSSAMPSPATGVQPTPTAVSSAKPPVKHHKHHKHHQTVSSVMPTPPVHI